MPHSILEIKNYFLKQRRYGWKYIAKLICHEITLHNNIYSNNEGCIYELKRIVYNLKCVP